MLLLLAVDQCCIYYAKLQEGSSGKEEALGHARFTRTTAFCVPAVGPQAQGSHGRLLHGLMKLSSLAKVCVRLPYSVEHNAHSSYSICQTTQVLLAESHEHTALICIQMAMWCAT